VKIVCNLADTVHAMMRNRGSTHTIDIVTKTYKLMQDLRVDNLMRMHNRPPTNMMMIQDLLAAHMMRTTSLANSSSPYPSSRVTTMPMPIYHGSSKLTRSSGCTTTPKKRKLPWLPLSLKAMPIFGGNK
jgi:hypothetical protein